MPFRLPDNVLPLPMDRVRRRREQMEGMQWEELGEPQGLGNLGELVVWVERAERAEPVEEINWAARYARAFRRAR